MARVFISYRRDDSAYAAEALYQSLASELGAESVFFDIDSIPLGDDFESRLTQTVERCDVLLAVIGDGWIDARDSTGQRRRLEDRSDFVRIEIETALAKEIRVIPVLVGRASMPSSSELPAELRALAGRNAAEVRAGRDFGSHLTRLTHEVLAPFTGRIAGPAGESPRSNDSPAKPLHTGDAPAVVEVEFSYAELARQPDRALGSNLGRFRLQKVLGAGGSGVVYKAVHQETGEVACLKLAYPMHADVDKAMAAVRRGIRGVVALNHPRVAKIGDFGRLAFPDGSSFFLEMAYVAGEHLGRWTRQQADTPTAFRDRLARAEEIASTLASAHEATYIDEAGIESRGVLHGDLKPQNIIVHPSRGAFITDFMLVDVQRMRSEGLASAGVVPPPAGTDSWGDQITGVFGTPGYMAPEQESEGFLTVRSDIYGLGMTFRDLFFPDVGDVELVDLTRSDPVAERLAALLAAMTDPNPRRRPSSVARLVRELETLAPSGGERSGTSWRDAIFRVFSGVGRISFTSGLRSGEQIRLRPGTTRLGAAPGNDVVIEEMSVSRHHAEIRCRGRDVRISDLRSMNGTFVNGAPVAESRLAPGDTVRIGEVEFVFSR